MQIYAHDSRHLLTHASEADRRIDYFCPECKGLVRLRKGDVRAAHFYHIHTKKRCSLSGKSLTHLVIQYFLQSILPPGETQLEKRFPQVGRIADVAWIPKKLIFEVQCSPISEREIRARNRDYLLCGYHVVWLPHTKQFSTFPQNVCHYFTNMAPNGEGIIFDKIPRANLPVDLSKPFSHPSTKISKQFSGQLGAMIVSRLDRSTLGFRGDLIDRLENPPPFLIDHFLALSPKVKSTFQRPNLYRRTLFSLMEKILGD